MRYHLAKWKTTFYHPDPTITNLYEDCEIFHTFDSIHPIMENDRIIILGKSWVVKRRFLTFPGPGIQEFVLYVEEEK